jgi:hypothetical protein
MFFSDLNNMVCMHRNVNISQNEIDFDAIGTDPRAEGRLIFHAVAPYSKLILYNRI